MSDTASSSASGSGPRIAPVTDDEQSDEVRAFFEHVEGAGLAGLANLNIVRTLARHPQLGRRYFDFGQQIMRSSTLPQRLQVLATMRTAWLYDCEYEWSSHVRIARRSGMTAEEVDAVKLGAEAPGWTDLEQAVLRAVDELHHGTTVGDGTWQALAEALDPSQLLDLLFTIGHYAMLAMVLNAIRVAPERRPAAPDVS